MSQLFPVLFILFVDVMTRELNQLVYDTSFVGYSMPKWSYNLNHLAYADDTIIFFVSKDYSIEKIVKILKEYELESGQRVNRDKIFFYMH